MDEKSTTRSPASTDEIDSDSSISRESAELLGQQEKNDLTDEEGQRMPAEAKRPSRLITWIIVNIISTITIVRHSVTPSFWIVD